MNQDANPKGPSEDALRAALEQIETSDQHKRWAIDVGGLYAHAEIVVEALHARERELAEARAELEKVQAYSRAAIRAYEKWRKKA